ncbi:P-aminobenzoate N-oxygenase AurF (plasmid) [Cylindrospermum stagnale PCC 7417]|uniref:p-aminobenzoate N-oxygenase AurF n=1 Tax=Cylindrospermum stagnale PCC 7417 TaxID=56107 RepID=K9X6I1_9NOST|nr:diiron oxygenase [Cylindrospermum stagnale]AFZ28265.1 P-aminobenzoate N-oxygenase AurF [Cylindrospermum stagnale PCC 7417]
MLSLKKVHNGSDGYNSVFQSWHEQASIRVKSRRVISEDELEGKVFFPPESFPVISHPLIKERGEHIIKKLLIYRLYSYLDFTENLELQIVNPIAYKIAHNQLNIDMSREKRLDAYKIYVDEAYHALFSVDIKTQVEKVTGIASLDLGTPNFLQRLSHIQESVDSNLQEIIKVFWTIVSETLITGILAEMPKNKDVVTPVREMIKDHAQDESHHHVYFASLLETLWFQLQPKYRSVIGPLLPEMIFAFLEPDITVIKYCLGAVGLESQEIDMVVKESYSRRDVILGVKKAANVTLKHFDINGIFEDPYTAEAFEKSGLFS